MLGKILMNKEKDEYGYIMGVDEIIYFFHKSEVKEDSALNNGDLVEFEYILNASSNELPKATRIKKARINNDSNEQKNGEKLKIYKELYEILKLFPKEEREKIPKIFMEEIKRKMDNSHDYKIESINDLENKEMLYGTRVLLSIVYTDFLGKENK